MKLIFKVYKEKKQFIYLFCFFLLHSSCSLFSPEKIKGPDNPDIKKLISELSSSVPSEKLIHRSILSPDYKSFYITLSNKDFTDFNIHQAFIEGDSISGMSLTSINSEDHDDHGMSFSPDGNWLYFSSTRPRSQTDTIYKWSIWKSKKNERSWNIPEHVEIADIKNKHISHPSISKYGTLFFHVSDLDYRNMSLYRSIPNKGKYSKSQKVLFQDEYELGTCTPHIYPNEDRLIFASIGPQLDLHLCEALINGKWVDCKRLSDKINLNGQGNPNVLIDTEYLFYTVGDNKLTNPWRAMVTDLNEL